MLEDVMFDDRDIKSWEYGNEAGDDSPEQEFVTPDIMHPLRKVFLTLWLHSKE